MTQNNTALVFSNCMRVIVHSN